MNYICYNGNIVPEDELDLSPLNRGLMYGDGCFDTLRSYNGKFLLLQNHYEVLSYGLDYLGMKSPFKLEGFSSAIQSTLEANGCTGKDVIVRTQCWRKGSRGYNTQNDRCEWMITLSEIPEAVEKYSLATVPERTIPNESLNRSFKLSNGLNFILAARQATKMGCNDALMLNIKGFVSETTIANIFWIKGDEFFSPSEQCDLYPGITRELVKMAIKVTGKTLNEGKFKPEELLKAEAVFCSNSVREIFPVTSIDSKEIKADHPLFLELEKDFQMLKASQLK